MDDAFLDRQFYEHWLELGSLSFLVERAQPFAEALSLGRQRGEIGLAEEHFGTEKLGDFLSSIWRRLNENNSEHPVLLSTLPEDQQSLGLQMMALVAALAGLRVIYLGTATPLDELISAAARQRVLGVLLGVSAGLDVRKATGQLAYLKVGLPPEVFLGAGGAGAPPANPDFRRFQDLTELFQWARSWGSGR
jgi:methanogenic corrinoid protein MtbC1